MRFVIALAFIFLVSGYARADCRLSWCNDYANKAVSQNQQQVALKSRYGVPEVHGHYSLIDAKVERNWRDTCLTYCRQGSSKMPQCSQP